MTKSQLFNKICFIQLLVCFRHLADGIEELDSLFFLMLQPCINGSLVGAW